MISRMGMIFSLSQQMTWTITKSRSNDIETRYTRGGGGDGGDGHGDEGGSRDLCHGSHQ